jgi:hypothetical protein
VDEQRKRAYRVLVGAALLHLKWDLACVLGGLSWLRPRRLVWEARAVRTAAYRAYAFHNLAIHSAWEFERLDEESFWRDVEWFRGKCPDDRHQYRAIFDRVVRGEPVNIVAPDAGIADAHTGAAFDGGK